MKQFSKGTISKDFNKSISLINHTEKTIIVGVPNNEWENKIKSWKKSNVLLTKF